MATNSLSLNIPNIMTDCILRIEDTSVYNIENTGLQQFAAEVLEDILEASIKTYDRNQSTTDDSTESTD